MGTGRLSDAPELLPPIFPSGSRKVLPLKENGSYIVYEDSGPSNSSNPDTPAVLCVPGLGDLRHQYRFLAPLLVSSGYRTLVSDLRGQGESSASFKSYTPADSCADIFAVLDDAGVQRAVLVSNSFAAAAITLAATAHPARVAALVALGGFFRDMPADKYFRPASHMMFMRPWGVWMWATYYATLFHTKPADFPAYTAALQKSLRAHGRLAALGKLVRASKAPAWDALPGLQRPLLALYGGKDPDFTDVRKEADTVSGRGGAGTQIQTVVYDDAGHYPHVEHPKRVLDDVLAFLRSHGVVAK